MFEKNTNIQATDYLSDAPSEYFSGTPLSAGPHVIRHTKNCGTHTVTKYSKGSWPTTDRIVAEFRLEGASVVDPVSGKKYRCLVIGLHGSNYCVCDEEGYETFLGSFTTATEAERRVELEISNRFVVDGAKA